MYSVPSCSLFRTYTQYMPPPEANAPCLPAGRYPVELRAQQISAVLISATPENKPLVSKFVYRCTPENGTTFVLNLALPGLAVNEGQMRFLFVGRFD
jgi:hypothetical protein